VPVGLIAGFTVQQRQHDLHQLVWCVAVCCQPRQISLRINTPPMFLSMSKDFPKVVLCLFSSIDVVMHLLNVGTIRQTFMITSQKLQSLLRNLKH